MQGLNLPSFDHKLKTIEGKPHIFDIIRRKYVALTPEEWVRQHFINLLVHELGYPRGRMAIEKGSYYRAGVAKRTDIMIHDEHGAVHVLVELKAPSVKLNRDVLSQLAAYNKTHNARWLMISNGIDTYCMEVTPAGEIKFSEQLPRYQN